MKTQPAPLTVMTGSTSVVSVVRVVVVVVGVAALVTSSGGHGGDVNNDDVEAATNRSANQPADQTTD